jgi:hypothetical protein
MGDQGRRQLAAELEQLELRGRRRLLDPRAELAHQPDELGVVLAQFGNVTHGSWLRRRSARC